VEPAERSADDRVVAREQGLPAAIAEADRILAEQSKSFGPLININKAIRDGLS